MRKLSLLGITLALVVAIMLPASVSAAGWMPAAAPARHFNAVLTPQAIDDTVIGQAWPVRDSAATNVWPVVDLVNVGGVPTPTMTGWIIDGRSISGDMGGDLKGAFTFTYGGVLDVLQSGSMQGIVTLKTGGLDVIYLAARGDLAAQVKSYYTFAEIQAWCGAVGVPVGGFFAQVYSTPALAGLPDEVLGGMYASGQVPSLPKTLTASFNGSVNIDAGTGAYSGIRGKGDFAPLGGKPLVLSVYPNQHVFKIEGAIKLTGTYLKQQPREIGKLDREKLRDAIEGFKGRSGK